MPVSLVMVLSENMVTMANMEYKKRYYLYPHPYVHLGGYIPIFRHTTSPRQTSAEPETGRWLGRDVANRTELLHLQVIFFSSKH